MSEGLFRNQVLDKHLNQLKGEILLSPPLPISLLSAAIVSILAIVVLYLALGSYSRSEKVTGYITVSEGSLRLNAPRDGQIKKLLVKEGEMVHKGQALMIITDNRILISGERVEERLLEEYNKQRELLIDSISSIPTKYTRRTTKLDAEIRVKKQERSLLIRQIANAKEQEALSYQEFKRFSMLQKSDFVSPNEVSKSHSAWLGFIAEKETQERDFVVLNGQIQTLELSLASLPMEQKEETSNLEALLSQLKQKIAQLSGETSYVLEAPMNGKVAELIAQEGERLSVNQFLLTLLPEGEKLRANLYVPSKAIGFIEKGQTVLLRYDAFPYQKFGLYKGMVNQIALSPSLPGEQKLPISLSQPMYRTKVQLTSDAIVAYGKTFRLKPGMTLEADIQLGKRSLLEWLLEPIFSMKPSLNKKT